MKDPSVIVAFEASSHPGDQESNVGVVGFRLDFLDLVQLKHPDCYAIITPLEAE
jgi:hypothetical protein